MHPILLMINEDGWKWLKFQEVFLNEGKRHIFREVNPIGLFYVINEGVNW